MDKSRNKMTIMRQLQIFRWEMMAREIERYKWMDSGCILEASPPGLAKRLNVEVRSQQMKAKEMSSLHMSKSSELVLRLAWGSNCRHCLPVGKLMWCQCLIQTQVFFFCFCFIYHQTHYLCMIEIKVNVCGVNVCMQVRAFLHSLTPSMLTAEPGIV